MDGMDDGEEGKWRVRREQTKGSCRQGRGRGVYLQPGPPAR